MLYRKNKRTVFFLSFFLAIFVIILFFFFGNYTVLIVVVVRFNYFWAFPSSLANSIRELEITPVGCIEISFHCLNGEIFS